MSDRIRELELEAIAYADSKVPARDRYNDIYHSIVRRKLADLIVRECAIMAKGFEFAVEREGLSKTMKEHFGIEQ